MDTSIVQTLIFHLSEQSNKANIHHLHIPLLKWWFCQSQTAQLFKGSGCLRRRPPRSTLYFKIAFKWLFPLKKGKKSLFMPNCRCQMYLGLRGWPFFLSRHGSLQGTYGAPPLLHCARWYWSDDIFTGLAHWSNTMVSHLLRILNSLTLFCVNPLANFKLAI